MPATLFLSFNLKNAILLTSRCVTALCKLPTYIYDVFGSVDKKTQYLEEHN